MAAAVVVATAVVRLKSNWSREPSSRQGKKRCAVSGSFWAAPSLGEGGEAGTECSQPFGSPQISPQTACLASIPQAKLQTFM